MTLARLALAGALCWHATAGDVAHFLHAVDKDAADDTLTFPSVQQEVAVARNLQGGYAQPGNQPYQNGGNYGYGRTVSQGGGSAPGKMSPLTLLLPVFLLLCLCLLVCQAVRCLCGGLCGDQADPLIGAGLGGLAGYEMGMGAMPGAVAGYEMGRYMDGKGVDPGAFGGLAGYEAGQYMGGGGYGGGYGPPMY